MTITYGLDCSNHQGNMTGFGGVAARFYVHKLTEGTGYLDPYAERNLDWGHGKGITLLGGYHYIRRGNGAGQADYFAARARALFGHDLRGHLWQLDCEADASWADVKAFKRQWDKGTDGAPILFYTGDWWLQPRGWNVASLGFAGLWSAPNRGYVGKANNVRSSDWHAGYGGFDELTICQYDARSNVGDTNQYRGTLAQLKALCAGSTEEDADMPLTDADVEKIWRHRTEGAVDPGDDWQAQSRLRYGSILDQKILAVVKGFADPAAFAAALVPLLQAAGPVSQDTLEAALRNVLGSLDD